MTSYRIYPLLPEKFPYANAPFWDDFTQNLYFVDSCTQSYFQYNYATDELLRHDIGTDIVSFIIPILESKTRFICGDGLNLKTLEWDLLNRIKEYKILAQPRIDEKYMINFGRADPKGRLWFGTTVRDDKEKTGRGSVFNFTYGKGTYEALIDIPLPNSTCWSLDGQTMFLADSDNYRIDAYSFDKNLGTAVNKRPVFNFKENNCKGRPQGMAIDCKGRLWIGCFEGNQVINIDPDTGKMLMVIDFNASQITSVTFGGPHMNELFVLSSDQPLKTISKSNFNEAENNQCGSIFKVIGLNVKGTRSYRFDNKLP